MKTVSLSNLPEEGVSHNPEIKKKVMLRGGEISNLTSFSQAYIKPDQVVCAHAHNDMYEIFLVEAGAEIIRVEVEEYKIGKVICIVVEPREVHDIVNTDSTDLLLTYFELKSEKNKS